MRSEWRFRHCPLRDCFYFFSLTTDLEILFIDKKPEIGRNDCGWFNSEERTLLIMTTSDEYHESHGVFH